MEESNTDARSRSRTPTRSTDLSANSADKRSAENGGSRQRRQTLAKAEMVVPSGQREVEGQRPRERKAERQEQRSTAVEGLQGQEQGQRKAEMRRMTPAEWHEYMKEMTRASGEKLHLMGTCVRHLLLRAPSTWGSSSRRQMEITTAALLSLATGAGEAKKKKHADLLPLPLSWSEEDAAWDNRASSPLKVMEDDSMEARNASKRAWVQAATLALNTLYEAPQSLDRDRRHSTFKDLTATPLQANERIALEKFEAKVEKS